MPIEGPSSAGICYRQSGDSDAGSYLSLDTPRHTVTVIDQRPTILDFLDQEMIEALSYHMRRQGATFRLGETVTGVERDARGRVLARLESGKTVQGDALLYTVGRQANTEGLALEAAGLQADSRGRIAVNDAGQTAVPHIYAAGGDQPQKLLHVPILCPADV